MCQELAQVEAERDSYRLALSKIDLFTPNPGDDPYPAIALFCKREARKALYSDCYLDPDWWKQIRADMQKIRDRKSEQSVPQPAADGPGKQG
jgi:hypothetical protein